MKKEFQQTTKELTYNIGFYLKNFGEVLKGV
jgi:hypothetical protein